MDALKVVNYNRSLSYRKWQSGPIMVTEHSTPTDPCGLRVSIVFTRNGDSAVRFQAVKAEYGGGNGEFVIGVVLCQDSGLTYISPVSMEYDPHALQFLALAVHYRITVTDLNCVFKMTLRVPTLPHQI